MAKKKKGFDLRYLVDPLDPNSVQLVVDAITADWDPAEVVQLLDTILLNVHRVTEHYASARRDTSNPDGIANFYSGLHLSGNAVVLFSAINKARKLLKELNGQSHELLRVGILIGIFQCICETFSSEDFAGEIEAMLVKSKKTSDSASELRKVTEAMLDDVKSHMTTPKPKSRTKAAELVHAFHAKGNPDTPTARAISDAYRDRRIKLGK